MDAAELRKLAQKKRSRNNLEEVQSALSELTETKDQIESWLEQVEEARSALDALRTGTQELNPDLIDPKGQQRFAEAIEAFQDMLPEEGSTLSEFTSYFEEAESKCDELDSMLDDRDYSADDREDAWGEILDQLESMATALDELECVGVALEPVAKTEE